LPGPPADARSAIVAVRRGDRWLVHSVRDYFIHKRSNYQHLKQLEWMIGRWVDAEPTTDEVAVESACDWTVNKNYIIRRFSANVRDRASLDGTQVIGWDPRISKIRSWVFDSGGAYVEGIWRRDGKRWIIETTGVLQDGTEVSAVNVLTYVDNDTCKFESRNRRRNGQPQPNIDEIVIKRVKAETDEPKELILPGEGPSESVLP
jgi:hypothetical protein